MTQPVQVGWTRLVTATGRYEYQFQGSSPTVRGGRYEDARDFQFLVLDEEGWLYRIPVRMPVGHASAEEVLPRAEAQLRKGLETFRPRNNVAFEELDQHFALRT